MVSVQARAMVSGALDLLEMRLGDLPTTVESQSPREARHCFFRAPGLRSATFSPSVALRAGGGSPTAAVLPPSEHRGGGAYRWINRPVDHEVADLPEGWANEARRRSGLPAATVH